MIFGAAVNRKLSFALILSLIFQQGSSSVPTRSAKRRSKANLSGGFRRWLLLLFAIVSLSATTAFSTTFSLKPQTTTSAASTTTTSSLYHPINTHGLPSKTFEPVEDDDTVLTSDAPHDNNNNNNNSKQPKSTKATKPVPTGNANLAPPSPLEQQHETSDQKSKRSEQDDDEEKMPTPDDHKFKERILSSLRTVQSWENVQWIQDCRAVIPWEDLRNETGPYSRPEKDRMLAEDANAIFLQRLCRWFRSSMVWVNTPPCSKCGHADCEMKTVRGPETDEEKEGNAKRVEVYYCPECKANTTTFPRYNKARKLLDTRKGRCGEYSNLFGLFCRAVGFETRLVLDLSDHLWTEVRLGDSWIMADSCEGIIDKPSMYEYGWGKEGLCFMIAMAWDHVVEVTPRYSRKLLSDDFQNKRRTHTTSENATQAVIHEVNIELQRNLTMSKTAIEELGRRRKVEEAELQFLKQSTEWTEQEKYGRGRISGSMAWKQSRSEAGKSDSKEQTRRQVANFEVESYAPALEPSELSLRINPRPVGRHDGISVGGTACAVGETSSLSLVVVDEKCQGCVLQSRSFLTWEDAQQFVNGIPSHRIIVMNGNCSDDPSSFDFSRLGGWNKNMVTKNGIAFIGQVELHPEWAYFSSLADCPTSGYEIILNLSSASPTPVPLKLRTERYTYPRRIASRLPESIMPLKTQLLANDYQKRLAFISFTQSNKRYSGYVTKAEAPVYLLNSTSFPFSKIDPFILDVIGKDKTWNTFHFLPEPLVAQDDNDIQSDDTSDENLPRYEVPLESAFFNRSLGPQLLATNGTRLSTEDALHNVRLVGLYFSAHWCGPCRSFTPMLAEMYTHLKEHRPIHGLEIVFVSGDRDESSFTNYFRSMPWNAIPFDHLQAVKMSLNMTYGIRGIPSLVILDAVSGQVVVPATESRQAVSVACRGGEQQIEALLDTWLERTPAESKEILNMLELSCQEDDPNEAKTEEPAGRNYLFTDSSSLPVFDTAARIKAAFEKLVAEGNDPTTAAAKAIGIVAEEQKTGRKFKSGPLSDKAIRSGPVETSQSPLEVATDFAVDSNSKSSVVDVLGIAAKYVDNAMKEPWSVKFRSFRLSNKVADRIARLEGCTDLLQSLGFEMSVSLQDYRACIPVSVDLPAMQERISKLIDDLSTR